MYLHYVFVTFNTFHKRDFMNCMYFIPSRGCCCELRPWSWGSSRDISNLIASGHKITKLRSYLLFKSFCWAHDTHSASKASSGTTQRTGLPCSATLLLSSCSSHSQGQVVAYRTNIITLTRPWCVCLSVILINTTPSKSITCFLCSFSQ